MALLPVNRLRIRTPLLGHTSVMASSIFIVFCVFVMSMIASTHVFVM